MWQTKKYWIFIKSWEEDKMNNKEKERMNKISEKLVRGEELSEKDMSFVKDIDNEYNISEMQVINDQIYHQMVVYLNTLTKMYPSSSVLMALSKLISEIIAIEVERTGESAILDIIRLNLSPENQLDFVLQKKR
jgi:hypothetical protein